jgi:hypothetical protein
MARGFMSTWKPIKTAEKHLGLRLDAISYLNLPLATHGDLIRPSFGEAYFLATAKQIELLGPDKIVFWGKGAYEKYCKIGGDPERVRYIEQRNNALAPSVRAWLMR